MAAEASPCPPRPRILFLTNAEHGQANVCLATSHALLELGAEIHFASFSGIRETVNTTLPGVVFHQLQGPDMKEIWARDIWSKFPRPGSKVGMTFSPNIFNMVAILQACFHSVFPWSGPEYVEVYRSVLKVVQEVQPSICVIDPALNPALTACRAINQRFIMLAPNTIKDFAMLAQPAWEQFTKYPCLASGFPYPIPWYLVPLNIYYVIVAIIVSVFDFRRLEIQRYVKEHTGVEVFQMGDLNFRPSAVGGVKVMVANRQELEWPLKVIPPYIIPCGPIIRPAAPVSEADPELEEWLRHGPTIYINLGTHVELLLETALEMAAAIRQTLETAEFQGTQGGGQLQVLWKLKKLAFTGDEALREAFGKYMATGRVRIVEWLTPEPAALVMHESIAVVVNHGGANSFLEAVAGGKPQIILPAWMDCFDFANRAEFLGIGVWGNKATTSRVTADGLHSAFLRVLVGPEAAEMKQNAARLSSLCNQVPGRVVAAKTILAEIDKAA